MPELPLIARAMSHADRIALRCESSTYSYNDLLVRSAAIALYLLQDRADLNERRVACLVPTGADYVAAQWGIWRAGGVFVPLSTSATEPELEYALADSQAEILLASSTTTADQTSLCRRLGVRLRMVDELTSNGMYGGTPQAARPSRLNDDPEQSAPKQFPQIDLARRAMILYTSGTTSRPKGVVTTHANIQAQITSLIDAWQWQPTDAIPLFLPLHHIHGIINVLDCGLWAGASVDCFRQFEMDWILRRVAAGAYSLFMAVPTIYVKLIKALEAMPEGNRRAVIDGFSQMRLMISGSAALPASVHETWTALTGQKLLERYGMTEIGMGLSNPYHGERRPGAVGRPLPGVEVRLKSDAGDVLHAESEPGEIQVRGPGVFLEYWNRPKITADSFDDGWFRTGDMAVVDSGYYRIMGRQSVDIIKSGGYKLSALEIEAALLDHPAIVECAVVGVPDELWGEVVAVAIVLEPHQSLDLQDLRDWCGSRLSHYRIPKRLLIVEQLPRNALGKVTKPTVRELFN